MIWTLLFVYLLISFSTFLVVDAFDYSNTSNVVVKLILSLLWPAWLPLVCSFFLIYIILGLEN